MLVHLYLAPAAAGKTAYAVARARDAARGLPAVARVCVPTRTQVHAWRRRLAQDGGAIGVRVMTFDGLVAECLAAAGEVYVELSEPVQYRLLRAIVAALPLRYYAPLAGRPGFVDVLSGLVAELKAGRIQPADLAAAVSSMDGEPRLRELAGIYAAYQERLQAGGWADRAGMAWLAVEALEERARHVGDDWPLLVADGFDNFTATQIALLRILRDRVGEMVITLTGGLAGRTERPVDRRFRETCRRLEAGLQVVAEPLPHPAPGPHPVLAHLEPRLFGSDAARVDGEGCVELVEAPDRAAEVRAALRWLKERVVRDGMRPSEVALLARAVDAYRPFILQTAAEFCLPVRLVGGLPLPGNPAVAAVLDLLRLALPAEKGRKEGSGLPTPPSSLPRRLVVEAWRSPYFDWRALPGVEAPEPVGIGDGDALALDMAARWGRVIAGRDQWEETLERLAERSGRDTGEDDDERGVPPNVPVGAAAAALLAKLRRFVARVNPPPGRHRVRHFVAWLEDIVGAEKHVGSNGPASPDASISLQVVACAWDGPLAPRDLDMAALRALKDVLRGLVWADEAAGDGQLVEFGQFFRDLVGAVDTATYEPPSYPGRGEILVADVVQARGLPFRAVAVVGLAEGEFPAVLGEDPFLRDADRLRLRRDFGLPVDLSTESAEFEFFYETVTRPRERLLLTRPRLADNGATWQASPFWEEVRRLVAVEPERLTGESLPEPRLAASWPELLESLAARPGAQGYREWVERRAPERWAAVEAAREVIALRHGHVGDSPFDGRLDSLAGRFAGLYGPDRVWSASRLESYRTCPFHFFIASVLALEPRVEPEEGLDARQLGNLYHRILEEVCDMPGVARPGWRDRLGDVLDAANRILDAAPRREGFRETAWWVQTRREIVDNVCRSLDALAELAGDFHPIRLEAPFGMRGDPLVVTSGGEAVRLRGIVDRIDRDSNGRLRIIDYKTAGSSGYTTQAVLDGKKLQLPLYALAARDVLRLGEPADGFYWHVREAQPSRLNLRKYPGGPDAAYVRATQAACEAVAGARSGRFVPSVPPGGCPAYCPGSAFCWSYEPRSGG